MLHIGVDLGGTNIKAALIDDDGNIIKETKKPTDLPRTAESICDDIVLLCDELSKDNDVKGIGVGCPGIVDNGIIRYSNNLDWHDFAMGSYLTKKTGMPVFLANDANAAALGEAVAGCAKGAESAVIITLGTGVGGGVVLNGDLMTGYTGAASEPGHMVIFDTPNAPLCTCGRHGCFESMASATALIRMTKEAIELHPKSIMCKLSKEAGEVTGRTAFDAAELGDKAAKDVVNLYIHHLAVGIANLINIFFPQVVGLSGGVANQGESLLKPLREAVDAMVFGNSFIKKHTVIRTCTLGYHAGVIGAAMLAKKQGG